MNFDTWYDLYSYPYESREDAAERFADEQGYEDPAEKQGFLDSLPEYETITPLDQQAGYDYGFGDWTPPEEAPAPVVSADYEDDPSLWDSTKRGIDLAQASAFGVSEGAGAGFLEDIGLTDASKSLKEWSREGRLRNEAEAATVAPAKSIKEEVAANPDSLYKYLDEDMMTWGQMAEAAPTSLAPFAAALPLALATPYLAAAAGIAATGTLGSTLLSAGVGMGVGNVASSAFVSSEAYERGKSDRIIREQLGVDPDKKFEDLLPSDQQKVDKVATDLSQTSFGHRLYTAGLVEMASYIPYGHAMVRLALDTGLGTASEVWDRTLYSEDAVDALIENGVPPEKAEELREAIIQAGPGFRETLIAAFQQELVMGTASTGIESLIGQTDPRVNRQATASGVMNEEFKTASKLHDERQQKQIELDSKSQADREKQELRERIQRDQQDRKFYDASLLEELKQKGKEKTEAEQLAKDREAIQYDLEDTAAFFEAEDTNANRELAELESAVASEFPGTVEEGREGQAEEKGELKADFYGSPTELRSAKEIEASFKKNLPQSVEALQNEQQVIQEDMARFKKGSDLERAAKKRQEDIKVRIKELTDIEAGKDTTKARLQEKEAITKEEKVLANMEKKIFGVKGEDTSRFGWSAEKFVEYNAYRKRKLKLQQRKELANPKLQTQEQVQRRKAIQKEEIKAQATKDVDQTIKPSAIQSEGGFGFDLDFIRKYVDDLGKRHEKYKGIYTVLSSGSPQNLADIFFNSKHTVRDSTTGKDRPISEVEALELAKQQLDDVNAFVYKGHVYVVAENIKGADKKAAIENLVKIVTFHEPITHLGLKEYLGDDYKPFLDNFYNTNKKDIRNWAETEALTEQDQTPAYLLSDEEQAAQEKGLTEEEVVQFRNNQNRDLAEEFLANKFVELGILDPDILTKTADSLLSVLKGVLDPQNKRVTTVQARSVLAEVQRSYLGGKKNIITGDLFDPANWTMKGFEVEAGEDKVEAYRKYLKEQGIVIEKGEKEFIKKEFAPRPTKPKTVKEEVFKKAPFKMPIYASKRTMSPRQAEIWKANNKKKGKGRRPRNPILVALAKKLETGKATYEEYRDKVNKLLPIKKFQSVPVAATDEEILGSIDKGQYKEGLLLGEDTLRSGKDIVNVRLDIPAYERFNSWVATITHGEDTIYGAAVRLKNVTFKAPPKGALRIAQGAQKTTLATMKGTWQADSITNIEEMAKDYLDNPAWVQIGYNPERQSSFYLRENKTINGQEFEKGTPLSSAEEVIQVGAFVLAKNVTTKATPSLTIGDVTFKYSKKQGIDEKAKTTKESTAKSRKATEQFDSTPIPLAWLRDLGAVSALKNITDNIAERFGSNGNKVDAESLKIYNLDPLIGTEEKPNKKLEKLLKEKGFKVKIFSFDPARFKLPNFKKDSYHNGTLWLYDPAVDEASFHDENYTRAWRLTHELGHAVTENFMEGKYGPSVREGRLGVKSVNYRGVPPKRAKVEIPAITLQEAQRAVEWEDVAFRAQRKILEDLGVKVKEADFAKEYNGNIKGALHRILTGDFDDPISDGFRPNQTTVTDLRGILQLLETTENQIAKAQGRTPTKGVDLKTWEPITDSAIVEAVNNPVVANKPKTRKGIKALSDPNIETFKFSRRLKDGKTKTAEKTVKGKTKSSDETGDSTSGTTAKSPYEGRLDVESDGQSHFVHWSNSPDLIETDPSYYGTGIKGQERKKKKQYPDIFVPRTYIGLAGYSKEMGLGKNMYETNLDPTSLYDIESTDRVDLWEQAVDEMGFDTAAYSTRFEGLLKEAGYAGYFNKTHNVAVLFNPTKVNFTKEIIGPSTFVPSIRGDQSIKASKRTKNPMYDAYYERNTGIFYRGTAEEGKGTGLGALGAGVYLSQDSSMARGYAKGEKIKAYKIKEGLNIADADGADVVAIKKMMGFEAWEYSDEPMYAKGMTMMLKDKGYDGAMSGDRATGIVIFDEKNIKAVSLPKVDPSIKASKAFHGSRATFDKFTTDKMGTGEGQQAYGWGLYFAGKKNVADWYKNQLSNSKPPLKKDIRDYYKVGNVINLKEDDVTISSMSGANSITTSDKLWGDGDKGKVISLELEETYGMDFDPEFTAKVQHIKEDGSLGKIVYMANRIPPQKDFKKVTGRDLPGGVYQVDLAPKDHEYLMHDLPLNQQSKTVKDALLKALNNETFTKNTDIKTVKEIESEIKDGKKISKGWGWHSFTNGKKGLGMHLYKYMSNKLGDKNTSQYLNTLGIKGIKYIDGSTRYKTTEKSYNYVIFDESNVSIEIKYSKRLAPEQELEAEWRENLKGKVKGKLPEEKKVTQKDKVTISKEAKAILSAKATRADISPKAILDPEGNIKTSKILASRASMFALRSGGVNTKDMPWRYRLAERLTRSITPQGTLPDRLKYLAIRRLIKGKIKGAEDASKALYNILKNTKQADVIYKYFTTRDFDANKITNKAEREAAIDAKARIDEIGDQLVKSDLLDEGAREQYKGMYLPQVYLKYLLKEGDNPFIKVRGGGGIQIDQNYLKKRLSEEDLPKEIRELVLGQIKDPAYLASKAISIPAKDMAILDWLQQIAGNEDWVAKDSLVSFDTFAEIRKAKLPLEVQKALELKDTKGVKVSGHWLKNESDRIWGMIPYMNLDKADMDIVEKLVTDMAEVSNKAFDKPYDPKLYAIVPKTKKYGMLAGMALRKEIANDIFGGMNMQTGDMSMAENILGDGGKLGSFNRFWKWSKVSANPPSWVRNFVSNMILMNMGGVPFWKMPSLITSSLADMQGKGKYKGQLHQLARDLGLTAGNFSNIELGRIEREFKDLQIRMKNKGGPMNVIGMMKGAFNKVQDVTSDTYGGIDTLGKMMILKHSLDKNKIKIKDLKEYGDPGSKEREALDDIAYNAEKWLFDYSNVLPSVKYLRNVPFGAPFASFTSFVAPLMLETAITKPWKFLPYYALGYAMKELFKDEFELDDEQYEGLKVSMSDYLREKAYGSIFPTAVIPFPFLDANKRIQFMDVSYLYPWGMFSEMAGEIGQGDIGDAVKTAGLLGSPGLNIASAIMTGIDPFTRKQIVDETGTNEEKAADLIWYAWNLSAPPMLHGIWQGPGEGYGAVKRLKDAFTGALAKDGEAKFTKGQAVGRMFGMNITPIAVPEGRNKHLRWEYSKHNKLVYKAKRELSNMLMMRMDMGEIKKEGKKWGEKILKSQEEFREKVRISTPPITLLREREKFLREKARSAQQYRASL